MHRRLLRMMRLSAGRANAGRQDDPRSSRGLPITWAKCPILVQIRWLPTSDAAL
jgi:hypothetical protein